MAIDLGTTNVVGFLIDLTTGERLASLGVENPQVAWGADVVTRLNHALAGPEAQGELRAAAALAIQSLARDLAEAVGRTEADIVDVAVCGNTAMQHCCSACRSASSRARPSSRRSAARSTSKRAASGSALAPSARVHAAPGVGGFVGSDHVAALLATRARWDEGGATLVMDIGTNTEISLVSGGRIAVGLVPFGSGAGRRNIACGMRAAEGAIERVGIENGAPRSRRRSAAARRWEFAARASWTRSPPRFGWGSWTGAAGFATAAKASFVWPASRRSRSAADVHILQADVRAVQLAKAAIRTGVDLLLDLAGVAEQDVERFVLAGAFGQYVDIANAVAIGLLPPLPLERYAQVGNTAGAGVARMLASTRTRARDGNRRAAALCRARRAAAISGPLHEEHRLRRGDGRAKRRAVTNAPAGRSALGARPTGVYNPRRPPITARLTAINACRRAIS